MKVWIVKERAGTSSRACYQIFAKEPEYLPCQECAQYGNSCGDSWQVPGDLDYDSMEVCSDIEKVLPALKKMRYDECHEFNVTLSTLWEPNL